MESMKNIVSNLLFSRLEGEERQLMYRKKNSYTESVPVKMNDYDIKRRKKER